MILTSPLQSDWQRFLHLLGLEIFKLSGSRKDRLAVFLSVPFLDYAGVLIASGILVGKYRSMQLPPADPNEWQVHRGKPVSFPVELRGKQIRLRRWVGRVKGVEEGPKGTCLAVTYLDNLTTKGKEFTRFVKPRWLPAVRELEMMPDLDSWRAGSCLASDVQSLDKLLGENGSAALIGQASPDCQILDVQKRVSEELKDSINLSRFGLHGPEHHLILADLMRPDGSGPEAMRETYSSRIAAEPDPGWGHTLLCGSLNLLRFWDEADSPVQVALISPSENAYSEAVDFVNELFYQRAGEVPLPDDLMALKPPAFDIQLITCKQ